MAREQVKSLGYLHMATKELKERKNSKNNKYLYGVSDYACENVSALIERHKFEWKFLNDENVPSRIKQYFFELKLMLEGYSLGHFRTALSTCTFESLKENKDKLFEFYRVQCGFSEIPVRKVVDVVINKKNFLPSCIFDEDTQTWRTNFDDILYEYHVNLFVAFAKEKYEFAFTSYLQDYIRTMTFAKLASGLNSSTQISKFFKVSGLNSGWSNMEPKDIESRKSKFKDKLGHWLDNIESDYNKVLAEKTRNSVGRAITKRCFAEIDEEKSCLDGGQPHIANRPVAELKFENEEIGFRIIGI